jgi:hypothetical protein
MHLADTLELTRLDRAYIGDSTFPDIDPDVWNLEAVEHASGIDRKSGATVRFQYQTWRRRR